MPRKDAAFMKLARERFKQGTEATEKQRERELADLRFYAGEQWDKGILDSRKGQTLGSGSNQQIVPARPSLTINKTLEPVRQIINQERQSDMGVELIPADDFGEMNGPIDHTEIELREGLVRRIQRDSEASTARTWAFSRSAIAGIGYWLVMTRFVPGKSWDQEVYVQSIYNQASVVLDPAHEQPDGSDAGWGFYGTDLPIDVYESEHPSTKEHHNRVTNATDEDWRALGDEAPGWFTTDGETRSVRVMNYYYTERETRELALMEDGTVAWVDELPEGVEPKETRSVIEKKIYWAKIDGVQVLDETEWPGHYIPIIKVVGEELQPYDGERRCQGVVRPMRDACQGNNYIISKFVERVGLTPIPPIMLAGGQDEGYTDEYNAINTRTLGRIHYNQKDEFNTPAPPPFRLDARSEIADIGMGVQLFGQAIVSTSNTPETALGHVDPSVKSGKLAKALIDQAERGTSNFLDNLVRSMRHEARIINDLLYPIYGARQGRLVRMMNPQGEKAAVLIGQPFMSQGEGANAKPQPLQTTPGQPLPPGAKIYQLTPDAEFNVAIKISKNEQTRREQEAQTLGEMIGADPTLMGVLGDLFFKYQDGPGHEEMSERMKAVLIPPVQAMLNGGQQPSNPQDQQKMAMMQEQIQQLTELADKNKTDLTKTQMQVQLDGQTTQLKEQSENQRTAMKLEADERAQALDNLVKLAIAEIQAQSQQAKIDAEQARTELGFANQHASESMDRQHEAGQAERDRQVQTSESERDRQTQTTEADKDRNVQQTEAERARQFEASQPEAE